MRILVLSACSASKHYDDGIDGETLDRYSRDKLINRERDPSRVLPAREMYTGDGHRYVADAVDLLQTIADVDIISERVDRLLQRRDRVGRSATRIRKSRPSIKPPASDQ